MEEADAVDDVAPPPSLPVLAELGALVVGSDFPP
ncbi:MAG: hypothetical protein JWP55_5169, partial [Mycobacterium sp.]|nr:hypothetical protein [Mycobacterium sp.]